jgi:hypothetical protein
MSPSPAAARAAAAHAASSASLFSPFAPLISVAAAPAAFFKSPNICISLMCLVDFRLLLLAALPPPAPVEHEPGPAHSERQLGQIVDDCENHDLTLLSQRAP